MTAAEAIVECIKREQIKNVFCVPGESYLPVLDALYDAPEIGLISTRHEGGASFMAEGYAKATGRPGIVLATRGVGAANLSIGVHTAYQDSTPMIILLGQVHSKFRGREGFQEVDLDRFFDPIAKWTVEVKDADRMPEIMQKAFRMAQSGRPGPVVISLPEDVLEEDAAMRFGHVRERPKPAPARSEVTKFKQILSAAKRPLIIAGGGVKSAGAETELVQFVEKHEIPVMAAFRRQDVFPNNHRLYAGHLGLGTNKDVLKTVQEADVIIALGSRLSEVTTQDYTMITDAHKLIHIDIDFDIIGNVYSPVLGIVADVKEALHSLDQLAFTTNWKQWSKERHEAFSHASRLEVADDDVINKHVIKVMKETLPEDTIITNDAGNFAGWLHSFYPFLNKHTYIGPTSGSMGYGMPAALGAKLANPDKPVLALAGDGGFMMTAQELETAVRYDLPVISLVFNNQMYGTIRMHQEMHYPEKVAGTDLGHVSFVALAESVGADGYLVKTHDEFNIALDKALATNKPAVIEIMTEKEEISVGSTITQIRQRAKNNN